MIHILDGQKDTILDYITLNNIIDDNHKKSLEDTLETYDFITFADKRFSEYLEKRNRIIIPDEDESLVEFVIFEAAKYKDTEGYKAQVFSHASYLELKKASILYPSTFTGTASQHGGRTLNDTGWQIGIVEGKGEITLTIENHTNPYEFLKRIAKEFGLELKFRVEHDGNKITGRYVDLLKRVGQWRGREVEFGKDLDGIRRVEKQDIVTALLGLGPEDENGQRLEVLVTDDDALQRWGRIDEHGNLKHLIEPYEIQSERSEMTETQARQYTRTALNKRINTQVTYECTIVDLENVPGMENKKIRHGDTIKIKDTSFNPPLYLEARIFEQNRSIKSKAEKDIKLGDFIEHTEEEVNAIWKQLQKQIANRITKYEMYEYTYDKLTIDDKDETVFTDGKTFAESVGIDAKEYADTQDSQVKIEVEDYADGVADSALTSAKQYAVAKTVYDNQMQQIASDIGDRAPLEYVDGQLVDKANKGDVYTITDVDNMINNTVSKTQYTTDMDGIVTDLESHGTRLGQNETAIGLKADQSSLNTVESSLSTQIGEVEVKADGVITSVSEVRADLDGLEIGGRNLIPDSNNLDAVVWRDHSGSLITSSKLSNGYTNVIASGGASTIKLMYMLDFLEEEYSDEEVTLSFDINNNGNDIKMVHNWAGGHADYSIISGFSGRYVYTGHITPSTAGQLRFDTLSVSDIVDIDIRNLQVEKGNKATDWTPAPEDVDGAISDVSGRVTTLDGSVTTLAGKVELKASQSVVDSLEDRVSTAEGELSVLPGQINAKVSKDGVIGAINATPEQLLIDFGKVKMTGELEAKHIKSLSGLNINNQFIVDSAGNVEFAGQLQGATGSFKGSLDVGTTLGKIIIDNNGFTYLPASSGNETTINEHGIASGIIYSTNLESHNLESFNIVSKGEINAKSTTGGGVYSKSIAISPKIDHGYIEFFRGYQEDRMGYLGVPDETSNNITLRGENGYNLRFFTGDYIYLDAQRSYVYGRLINPDTYNVTTGASANMYVASNGYFARSSSARKYKLLEEPIKIDSYKLLNIEPKTWFDKPQAEKYADELTKEFNGEETNFESLLTTKIQRISGLVAEDVEDAGLSEYVIYDDKGNVEGVQYDRLWTLLIPIIKDLKNEIEVLKNGTGR